MKMISTTSVIHENVQLGEGVIIHDFVVIYPDTIIGNQVEIFDGCVLGKPPSSTGTSARGVQSDLPPLRIGDGSVLCAHVTLYRGTTIGQRVLLGDGCSFREQCETRNDCIISRNVSVNYNTRIGNRVKVMDNTHLTGNMVIEDDVFISALVCTTNDNQIGRGGWHDKIVGPRIRQFASVGAGANLLPNITIGRNAIVGAGAVVTKDVPDRKVVMGIPARIVRDIRPDEIQEART
ncbi:MAG: transferase [Candidatus Marinimicrobia bacterium]|nr:transferase [Candidatus Neomarinimicrobiota bacterium]